MMKRPEWRDEGVRKLAAEKLLARLKDSGLTEYTDAGSDDEAIGQLSTALRYGDTDGYDLAQRLERDGWEPCAALVEALDGGCLDDALVELTGKWIAWHAIVPALCVGAKVTVKRAHGSDVADGQIVSMDARRGLYVVNVPTWGHTMPKDGYEGALLNWEDVDVLNVAVATNGDQPVPAEPSKP